MSEIDLNVAKPAAAAGVGATAGTAGTTAAGGAGTLRTGTQAPASRVSAAQRRNARALAGRLFLLGTLVATVVIVLDAAAAKSPLVPRQPAIAGYLNGPGSALDYRTFLFALLAMTACYAGAVWCGPTLSARMVVVAVVLLNLVVFAGPVLISQDVFQYIDYGRLGALHGLNPFVHGPAAVHRDPVFRYVGLVWHFVATAYGPLFTLMSYPIALLGVDGALWGMKVLALASSLTALGFVWCCARRLGRDPVVAVLLVGANPLWIIYGLGGAHNDLLMNALMMCGVWLTLRDEDARGAAAVIAGAAVKATCVAVLPFMLLARRRVGLVWGSLVALVVIGAISLLAFGVHGVDFVSVLNRNQTFVSGDSFPNEVAHLLGFPGVFRVDRTLLRVATVLVVLWLGWRTWRGYDWIAGASWALLLVAVTTTWLLAWYLLWALPMAVISRDRRVLAATMAVMALFVVHQCSPLFSPTS